jgi:hypothetical protein
LIEEPVHFGDGGRLSGILTFPSRSLPDRESLPWFVFFNAGLLHRVGPNRLYVRLARLLAQSGFGSLRIDQAGKGESPARSGLTSNASVAADYDEILRSLDARLGRVPLVLGGLCAGADDAIRLAPKDPRAIGLLLLDPICFPDAGFATRAAMITYARAARYSAWLKRRLKGQPRRSAANTSKVDPLIYRNAPTLEELRSAFAAIRERRGRTLSVFSEYALRYYNQPGQLARVANLGDADDLCTEVLWPETEHIYPLDIHRRRLMELVRTWAAGFCSPAPLSVETIAHLASPSLSPHSVVRDMQSELPQHLTPR